MQKNILIRTRTVLPLFLHTLFTVAIYVYVNTVNLSRNYNINSELTITVNGDKQGVDTM